MITVNAYFISGLGADKRAFEKTKLPPHFRIIHLDWMIPEKNETMLSYCKRFEEKIDRSKPFVLIGLSFGGMIACELSRMMKPLKVIIISSARGRDELPWYLKAIGKLRLHRLIPTGLLKWPNKFTFWIFGTATAEEKNLLSTILEETDSFYLTWSINEILNWKSRSREFKNVFHIHGTADRILPLRYVNADVVIKNGAHFMVLSRAEEVNIALHEALGKTSGLPGT